MRTKDVRIGGFASQPGDKECLEAVWSEGTACRTCQGPCYRQGWTKAAATADNRRLVKGMTEQRRVVGGLHITVQGSGLIEVGGERHELG